MDSGSLLPRHPPCLYCKQQKAGRGLGQLGARLGYVEQAVLHAHCVTWCLWMYCYVTSQDYIPLHRFYSYHWFYFMNIKVRFLYLTSSICGHLTMNA